MLLDQLGFARPAFVRLGLRELQRRELTARIALLLQRVRPHHAEVEIVGRREHVRERGPLAIAAIIASRQCSNTYE